jgi:transcriptional regulator with XRE-family HTH domain
MTSVAERLAAIRQRQGEGARLRAFRRSQGWTQAELASHLGVAPNTVARLERGERRITGRTWRQVETLNRGTPG